MLDSGGQLTRVLGLAAGRGLLCQGWLLAQGLGYWGSLASLLAPLWHSLKATEVSRRFEHGCQHTRSTPGSPCDSDEPMT